MEFEAVAGNLRESFRVIAASRGAGELRELEGVSIASAGVAFQMFNAAFLSGAAPSLEVLGGRVRQAAAHFEQRRLPWSYWACASWLPSADARACRKVFENHGLRHSIDLPGMVAEHMTAPCRPLPQLEVRRVSGRSTREAFCKIGSTCFHVPLVWFCEVFDSQPVWECFAAYVGYEHGEPVSTAAIVLHGATAGLYNLATLPAYERRGYGEAIMRSAFADVERRHPFERLILQSTPAGLHLYERMGFRTVTTISVYSSGR